MAIAPEVSVYNNHFLPAQPEDGLQSLTYYECGWSDLDEQIIDFDKPPRKILMADERWYSLDQELECLDESQRAIAWVYDSGKPATMVVVRRKK